MKRQYKPQALYSIPPKKNKWSKKKKITVIASSCFVVLFSTFLFLFYGPWPGFRNFWITSAMTTMSHQYLATIFYSDETIEEVLAANQIIETGEITDPSLVKFREYDGNMLIFKNKYEKEILTKDPGNDLYKVINIEGKTYHGFLVAIYDPSKVTLATSQYLGTRGEAITTVAKREKAVIAMNAGGFYDPDWNSNGAVPHGTVIKDGKIIEKKHIELPLIIKNIVRCKNPRCITTTEQELDHVFKLTNREEKIYRCIYCESKVQNN